MSDWHFTNGTKVKAIRYDEALNKMYHCDFTHHWAMEEEPGRWVVLFGPDVEVEVLSASDSFEAARKAIIQVRSEKDFLSVKPTVKNLGQGNPRKYRCCFLQRMCDPD
jgi:hypothetical protein